MNISVDRHRRTLQPGHSMRAANLVESLLDATDDTSHDDLKQHILAGIYADNKRQDWLPQFAEQHHDKVAKTLRDVSLHGTDGHWKALRWYTPDYPECFETEDFGTLQDVYEASPSYPEDEYYSKGNHPITFWSENSNYSWSPYDGGYEWEPDPNGNWICDPDCTNYARQDDAEQLRNLLLKCLPEMAEEVQELEYWTDDGVARLRNIAAENGFYRFSPGATIDFSFEDEAEKILLKLAEDWLEKMAAESSSTDTD